MERRYAVIATVCLASLATSAVRAADVSVQVLSATVKDKVVSGAQVILQKEGQASLTAVSDAQGKALIANTFGVDDPSVSMIIKKDGFSPLVVKCPCNGMAYAISETLQQLEAFRVVLNWSAQPQDLDLHVAYPNNHIFFRSKTGTDAFLDVDDTNGFGPETITIQKRHPNEKYVFAVHNYSAQGQYGTNTLSKQSQAKVFIYVGQSLIRSYYMPTGESGALWVLFAIDENGAFHDIDNIVDIAEVDRVKPYLKQLTERADFGFTRRASMADAESAKDLVQKGDQALSAGTTEQALEFYQKAVERNANFAPAFDGLAKAYQKLNRAAEAEWAKRKAGELSQQSPAAGFRVPNERVTLEASTSMKKWKHYTFTPDNLLDDNLWTSWQPVTKAAGGANEWLKMTFSTPQTLTGFEFSNGFRRIDDLGDLYVMNNRIKTATLQFSDGTDMPISFTDTPTEATFMLPSPKQCSWVKLTVNSVYKGTKWNDLAVSEFHALGQE